MSVLGTLMIHSMSFCRIIGRRGHLPALERFVDYLRKHDQVWMTRRIDIARHWHANHKARIAA